MDSQAVLNLIGSLIQILFFFTNVAVILLKACSSLSLRERVPYGFSVMHQRMQDIVDSKKRLMDTRFPLSPEDRDIINEGQQVLQRMMSEAKLLWMRHQKA